MPIDQYEGLDEEKGDATKGEARRFDEFDCPGCNANNPCPDPIGDGDEVLCNYCGSEYEVKVTDEGRLKLKEL